jgi:hypothetical protein
VLVALALEAAAATVDEPFIPSASIQVASKGYDSTVFTSPQSYCSKFGHRSLSGAAVSIRELTSNTKVERNFGQADTTVAELENLPTFELEGLSTFVTEDSVCLSWHDVRGVSVPTQGNLQVVVDLLDHELPVDGNHFEVSASYNFVYRSGAIGAILHRGPPPTFEDEGTEHYHVTVNGPTAFLDFDAWDSSLELSTGSHYLNSSKLLSMEFMIPRSLFGIGTPGIQRLFYDRADIFIPRQVDSTELSHWEFGFVVATSKNDVSVFERMRPGTHTVMGLIPLTSFRFVFKAYPEDGSPPFVFVREGTTDAPPDPFNLPAWKSFGDPQAFAFNKTNVVVRLLPRLTSGGSPVVSADVEIRDAIFHDVITSRLGIQVGEDVTLRDLGVYNFDILVKLSLRNGRVETRKSSVRGGPPPKNIFPPACTPTTGRKSANVVTVMYCKRLTPKSTHDVASVAVRILDPRTNELVREKVTLTKFGTHDIDGVPSNVDLQVEFAAYDTRGIVSYVSEVIKKPYDPNARLDLANPVHTGFPDANLLSDRLLEVTIPHRKPSPSDAALLHAKVWVNETSTGEQVTSFPSIGGKVVVSLPVLGDPHSDILVVVEATYSDSNEPGVYRFVLSRKQVSVGPMDHVGSISVAQLSDNAILVRLPETLTIVDSEGHKTDSRMGDGVVVVRTASGDEVSRRSVAGGGDVTFNVFGLGNQSLVVDFQSKNGDTVVSTVALNEGLVPLPTCGEPSVVRGSMSTFYVRVPLEGACVASSSSVSGGDPIALFVDSWVDVDSNLPATVTKLGSMCTLSGSVHQHGNRKSPVIGQLPDGCHPNGKLTFVVNGDGAASTIAIRENGFVEAVDCCENGGAGVSLSGITFETKNGSPISLKGAWVSSAVDRSPQFSEYDDFVVVSMNVKGNPSDTLLASISASHAPSHPQTYISNGVSVTVNPDGSFVLQPGATKVEHSQALLQGSVDGQVNVMLNIGFGKSGESLKLQNGWQQDSTSPPSLTQSNGLCLLSGMVQGGSSSGSITTLPTECRPGSTLHFLGFQDGNPSGVKLSVTSDGNLFVSHSTSKLKSISLSQVMFVPQVKGQSGESKSPGSFVQTVFVSIKDGEQELRSIQLGPGGADYPILVDSDRDLSFEVRTTNTLGLTKQTVVRMEDISTVVGFPSVPSAGDIQCFVFDQKLVITAPLSARSGSERGTVTVDVFSSSGKLVSRFSADPGKGNSFEIPESLSGSKMVVHVLESFTDFSPAVSRTWTLEPTFSLLPPKVNVDNVQIFTSGPRSVVVRVPPPTTPDRAADSLSIIGVDISTGRTVLQVEGVKWGTDFEFGLPADVSHSSSVKYVVSSVSTETSVCEVFVKTPQHGKSPIAQPLPQSGAPSIHRFAGIDKTKVIIRVPAVSGLSGSPVDKFHIYLIDTNTGQTLKTFTKFGGGFDFVLDLKDFELGEDAVQIEVEAVDSLGRSQRTKVDDIFDATGLDVLPEQGEAEILVMSNPPRFLLRVPPLDSNDRPVQSATFKILHHATAEVKTHTVGVGDTLLMEGFIPGEPVTVTIEKTLSSGSKVVVISSIEFDVPDGMVETSNTISPMPEGGLPTVLSLSQSTLLLRLPPRTATLSERYAGMTVQFFDPSGKAVPISGFGTQVKLSKPGDLVISNVPGVDLVAMIVALKESGWDDRLNVTVRFEKEAISDLGARPQIWSSLPRTITIRIPPEYRADEEGKQYAWVAHLLKKSGTGFELLSSVEVDSKTDFLIDNVPSGRAYRVTLEQLFDGLVINDYYTDLTVPPGLEPPPVGTGSNPGLGDESANETTGVIAAECQGDPVSSECVELWVDQGCPDVPPHLPSGDSCDGDLSTKCMDHARSSGRCGDHSSKPTAEVSIPDIDDAHVIDVGTQSVGIHVPENAQSIKVVARSVSGDEHQLSVPQPNPGSTVSLEGLDQGTKYNVEVTTYNFDGSVTLTQHSVETKPEPAPGFSGHSIQSKTATEIVLKTRATNMRRSNWKKMRVGVEKVDEDYGAVFYMGLPKANKVFSTFNQTTTRGEPLVIEPDTRYRAVVSLFRTHPVTLCSYLKTDKIPEQRSFSKVDVIRVTQTSATLNLPTSKWESNGAGNLIGFRIAMLVFDDDGILVSPPALLLQGMGYRRDDRQEYTINGLSQDTNYVLGVNEMYNDGTFSDRYLVEFRTDSFFIDCVVSQPEVPTPPMVTPADPVDGSVNPKPTAAFIGWFAVTGTLGDARPYPVIEYGFQIAKFGPAIFLTGSEELDWNEAELFLFPPTTLSFNLTDLTPGNQYAVRVFASNIWSESTPSFETFFTTPAIPPNATAAPHRIPGLSESEMAVKVRLGWAAPYHNGGFLERYRVQISPPPPIRLLEMRGVNIPSSRVFASDLANLSPEHEWYDIQVGNRQSIGSKPGDPFDYLIGSNPNDLLMPSITYRFRIQAKKFGWMGACVERCVRLDHGISISRTTIPTHCVTGITLL